MKKYLAIALLTMVTFAASAQHGRGRYTPVRSSHTVIRPQIRIGAGFGYGYGYNRFNQPYNSPYYNNYGYNRTTQLDLRIRDIENEYRNRIQMVRNDRSLPRSQRKAEIRSLRYEKERAIIEARRNYFNR